MNELKLERVPGVIHTIGQNRIDLQNFTLGDVDISDIAWGLGRTLRYGGHIREDWTVAHHSVVMSYVVPETHALEALLHDAAEAYIGDIIWPVKAMFPEIEEFENSLTLTVMDAFEVNTAFNVARNGAHTYKKSPAVAQADKRMLEHECYVMSRGGTFHQDTEDAWNKAAEIHIDWWWASQYAFLERFDELTGSNHFSDIGITDELSEKWFPGERKAEKALEDARINPTLKDDLDQAMLEQEDLDERNLMDRAGLYSEDE